MLGIVTEAIAKGNVGRDPPFDDVRGLVKFCSSQFRPLMVSPYCNLGNNGHSSNRGENSYLYLRANMAEPHFLTSCTVDRSHARGLKSAIESRYNR